MLDRDDLAVKILLTGNGPGDVVDARRAYAIADAMILESEKAAMIELEREIIRKLERMHKKLDHMHQLMHDHGDMLDGIADAVSKLGEPDPALVAAVASSKAAHARLKAALEAQPLDGPPELTAK